MSTGFGLEEAWANAPVFHPSDKERKVKPHRCWPLNLSNNCTGKHENADVEQYVKCNLGPRLGRQLRLWEVVWNDIWAKSITTVNDMQTRMDLALIAGARMHYYFRHVQ
jgi:hypothetical protein